MRKNVILALALAVFVAIPVGVSAQSWLGGLFSSSSQCGASSCAPGCEPCCPGGLKLDVGYLFGDRGVHTGLAVNNGTFFGRQGETLQYRLEGVQLGATIEAPLKDDVGVRLRGTWLFPSGGKASQTDDNVDLISSRDWSPKSQYYTVDGAVVYPFCAPLNVLSGFRFDSLSTKFSGPRTGSDFENSRSTDRAEVSFTGYIPYVGLGLNYGQALRLTVIGTPIFWADMNYHETVGAFPVSLEYKANLKNTLFLEAAAEYGASVGPGTASVLAKWTYMHATGSPTFKDRFAGAVIEQDAISTNLLRQNFYLAATFTVPVTSPW